MTTTPKILSVNTKERGRRKRKIFVIFFHVLLRAILFFLSAFSLSLSHTHTLAFFLFVAVVSRYQKERKGGPEQSKSCTYEKQKMETDNWSDDDTSGNDMAKCIKRQKRKEEDDNDIYIYSGRRLTEQEQKTVAHVTVADDVTEIWCYVFL